MATLVASYAGQSGATLYAGRFPAPSLSGKYRAEQPRLFVDVAPSTPTTGSPIVTLARASVADPKADYEWGLIGPSYYNVEHTAKWAWANAGGDWVNTAGTSQGTTLPHFTLAANAVTSGSSPYPSVPFTAAAQAAFARGKWNAFIVRVSGGSRSIAALHHPTLSAPSVSVSYSDGSSGALACTACVALTTGSAYTQVGATESSLAQNVALEFEMPTKAVSSAVLSINVTQHTATAATISGFLANPPVNAAAVVTGLAEAYPQDEGITAHPDVLFAQRFEDGTALNDYVIASPANVDFTDFDNWSPVVYGGTDDPTKLPTAIGGNTLANKWFQVNTPTAGGGFTLVDSSYTGDGFVPFGEGRGALRIVIPEYVAADGGVVGSGGALGCDLMTMFPKEVCGLLDEIFVRFKMRFNFAPKYLADSKMFRQTGGGTARYAVPHGKFGPGPHHWTRYGGNSNTGGNNLGWSGRLGFGAGPADAPLSGLQPFIHSQDMLPDRVNMPMGKDGGLGAGMYPDQTYEVEVRTKLNTYNAAGAIGTSTRDGVCEIWVDGRLDSTHTNWKWRDGAIDYGTTPNGPSFLAPFRELGIQGLCLNNFHGGTLPPDHGLVMFIGDIVAATSYIGPVKAAGPALPSWVPAAGEAVTFTVGDGVLENSFASQISAYYDPYWAIKTVNDYSSGSANPYYGTHGAIIYAADGGHASTNNNGVTALEFDAAGMRFRKLAEATPYFGTATDTETKRRNAYALDFPANPYVDADWGDPLVATDTRKAAPASHSYIMDRIVPPSLYGATHGSWVRFGHKYYLVANSYDVGGAHRFDINDNTGVDGVNQWSRNSTTFTDDTKFGASGPGYSALDLVKNRLYFFARSDGQAPMWLDLVGGGVTEGTGMPFAMGSTPDSNSGVVVEIPSRNLFVAIARIGSTTVAELRFQWMDATADDPTLGGTATLSASLPVYGVAADELGKGWGHACWCPDNNRIIVGGVLRDGSPDTAAYYEVELPTPITDEWTVTRRVLASGTIPWDVGNYGTWQRQMYFSSLKSCVYFPKAYYPGGGTDAVTVFHLAGL